MNFAVLVNSLRCSLLRIESRLLQAAGLETQLAPALAVNGPSLLPQPQREEEQVEDEQRSPGLLDGIMWMAAPKKRRTIEVNRTRRRSENKLIKVKPNIEPCLECGHLKQKHILCGFCYDKVRRETRLIRAQIQEMEGGPLKAPPLETAVFYEDETPKPQHKELRIVEMPRKRPAWFNR